MRPRFFLIITVFLLANHYSIAQSNIKAIRAGKLIDVVTGTVLTNQVILIDSNIITDIGPLIDHTGERRSD